MSSTPDRAPDERLPDRERQALREVGRTLVYFRTALATTLLFLAVIVSVPAAQWLIGPSPAAALGELTRGFTEGWRLGRDDGWRAGNRRLQVAIDDVEARIEDESLLRARLLPPVQALMTGLLGAGNEQVYVGRGGWLLYRSDVDHVTGPSFLDPALIERRRRGGEAWEAAPEPDPVPAIVSLARDLEDRGIELLVMPTPVKPSILPAALVWRRTAEPPLENPGTARFVQTLRAEGVTVLDVGDWIAALPVDGEAQYLTGDTHWTPRAMEAVAARLAEEITPYLSAGPSTTYARRRVVVESRGDIAAMLRLPAGRPLFGNQRVSISVVTTDDGRRWDADSSSEVLVLGDSFTNVFSDTSLGWGQGAGLAEQLSFVLGRSVDRIARNAGGSNATRRALADALAVDPQRLDGKRVVVYQFATRELSFGDWPVVPLPER